MLFCPADPVQYECFACYSEVVVQIAETFAGKAGKGNDRWRIVQELGSYGMAVYACYLYWLVKMFVSSMFRQHRTIKEKKPNACGYSD